MPKQRILQLPIVRWPHWHLRPVLQHDPVALYRAHGPNVHHERAMAAREHARWQLVYHMHKRIVHALLAAVKKPHRHRMVTHLEVRDLGRVKAPSPTGAG